MKNKIISFLLAFIFLATAGNTTFAVGDGNVDSGSGGMGSGSEDFRWSSGHDGVRVSIIDAATGSLIGATIDYTNITPPAGMTYFEQRSKIDYRNGATLNMLYGTYTYNRPSIPLPRIISDATGNANLEAIKEYFCSEGAAQMIANDFGLDFEILTTGNYRVFLEPIAYFRYAGYNIAMTAHEAALFDTELGGALRTYMAPLTHQNLPLAMFLERPDLGFQVFGGNKTIFQSNGTIMQYLGMGIVSYIDVEFEEPEPPEHAGFDVEYRTNTEVVTAVTLSSPVEINYKSVANVTFHLPGRSYTVTGVVMPVGESQLVWLKWTTPATAQYVTINITTNRGTLSQRQIVARIVNNYEDNPPPDPKATDRNNTFSASAAPSNPQRTSASWSIWWAWWQENWEWEADWQWVPDVRWVSNWVYVSDVVGWFDYGYYFDFGQWWDFGEWVDNGWWVFHTANYHVNLVAASAITPDTRVPVTSVTAIKSGYGINNTLTANMESIQLEIDSHITGAQVAISYFPEFKYTTYWRLLDLTARGRSARFEFRHNPFSAYNHRVHFTPVWFPNGSYNVYTYVLDAWTPVGMLSANVTGSINIQESVFDDWFTNRE
ncbi:MAG: hypothetical protein FWD23_18970 [Oscillospiraceae bacterium]|nr:hypothetical protein [Oscillospiraceae bacterium]